MGSFLFSLQKSKKDPEGSLSLMDTFARDTRKSSHPSAR